MNNSDKYRVQTKFTNPEAVRLHTGKDYRWVDSSAYHTKSEAAKARGPEQRIVKICTPSEGAMLVDKGAYPGRRFNLVVSAEVA